jgi:hypothetical protein
MNTQPLWDFAAALCAARLSEERALERREHLSRRLHEVVIEVRDLELATTRAALRGVQYAATYEPQTRVLRNQHDSLALDLALADIELARATFQRMQLERGH